jgi:transposase-like protein
MDTATPQPPGLSDSDSARGRWFSSVGCVVWSQDGEQAEVFVGGTLIGTFDRRERGARNVILVGLARDPRAHLGKLAAAFGVNAETLRRIRLQHEEEGLSAVVSRTPGGSERKLQGAARRRAEQLFARGATLAAVQEALAKLDVTVSRATLSGERAQWRTRTSSGVAATASPTAHEPEAPSAATPAQQELWDDHPTTSSATEDATAAPVVLEAEAPTAAPTATAAAAPTAAPAATAAEVPPAAPAATATAPSEPAFEEHSGTKQKVTGAAPKPGRFVQHLGSWLLLGSLAAMGVYSVCERERCRPDRPGRRLRRATVRVALDALIVALALGQRCVEGVRRVQTLTAGILLRASGAPAATWVRRALGILAGQSGASYIGLGLAGIHLRAAQAGTDDGPVVFYLDNHLRPYTGKEVVRKGWRMQDKRVLPGVTDCYVHDEDGRAAFRLDAPGHESLTKLAPRVTALLRQALGAQEQYISKGKGSKGSRCSKMVPRPRPATLAVPTIPVAPAGWRGRT